MMTSNMSFYLTCIALLVAPSVVALRIFFITLRLWTTQVLRDDSELRRRIKLNVTENRISWNADLGSEAFPWPAAPFEWAVVAALSIILIETVLLGIDPQVRGLWYTAGVCAAVLAFTVRFAVESLWPNKICSLIKTRIFSTISPHSSAETRAIQELALIGRDISDCFTEISLECRIDAIKNCQEILLRQMTHPTRDLLPILLAARKTLAAYIKQLRIFARTHEEARQEFDWAKIAIVNNGSTTLLEELDRIKRCMQSEDLARFVNHGQWDKACQLVDQIRFDLTMIQNLAVGGSDMPSSLEQAYRFLNVNEFATDKMIKMVVDALRRVWHPDLTSNGEDYEVRTRKTQQIHAAWEIVQAARVVNIDMQS